MKVYQNFIRSGAFGRMFNIQFQKPSFGYELVSNSDPLQPGLGSRLDMSLIFVLISLQPELCTCKNEVSLELVLSHLVLVFVSGPAHKPTPGVDVVPVSQIEISH